MRYLIILLFPLLTSAQDTIPHTLIGPLPSSLNESSGLQFVQGHLWTLEDGGGGNTLYELDTLTGGILRTVYVSNASNIDWEDLAADNDHLYIGDFGNNDGSRTNLRIYRVSADSLLNPSTTSVNADTISFYYTDQSSFIPAIDATNFDCEAMVVLGDSIHLFSKRWLDEWTTEYVIPAVPGAQLAEPIDSANTWGLVTGADISAEGELVLCGYRVTITLDPFVSIVKDPSSAALLSGQYAKYSFGVSLAQIEGIAMSYGSVGYVSAEDFLVNPARIWRVDIPVVDGVHENEASDLEIQMTSSGFTIKSSSSGQFGFEFYSEIGSLIYAGNGRLNEHVEMSLIKRGVYFLRVQGEQGVLSFRLAR